MTERRLLKALDQSTLSNSLMTRRLDDDEDVYGDANYDDDGDEDDDGGDGDAYDGCDEDQRQEEIVWGGIQGLQSLHPHAHTPCIRSVTMMMVVMKMMMIMMIGRHGLCPIMDSVNWTRCA